MKKRIRSLIICIGILFGMSAVSVTNAEASNDELKKVDGSYLTLEDSAIGTSSSNLAKGKHMMDGECSISKAGTNRVYAFGATTANHEVGYYYRVHADHFVREGDDPMEETFSFTDGIWVGPPKTTE